MLKTNFKILAVDDDETILRYIKAQLLRQGYELEVTTDEHEALSLIKKSFFDIVITDLYMPKMSGLEMLKEVKQISQSTNVIMMTASNDVSHSLTAMEEGAYDYLLKPISPELLLLRIEYLHTLKKQAQETNALRLRLESQYRFGNIIGKSKPMQMVFEKIQMVADSVSTIIVQGPSGTGKELIANALHYNSERRDKAFIKVSCGIFNTEILESELFGHEKGSFTGALRQKTGRFELADQGTIFLDDVDDIPLATQVKLLRVLQEREFERVGGEKTLKVDVRVIAATKKDLKLLVAEGKFREDLYYRLNVIPIVLPPLLERKEDIPLLISFFIKKFQRKKKIASELSSEVAKLTRDYEWPGNVRELENAVEHAVTFCKEGQLQIAHFPEEIQRIVKTESISLDIGGDDKVDFNKMVTDFEKKLLIWASDKAEGHQTKMAKVLNLPRTTLRDKLIRYNLIEVL
ncbi:sigma-54-dependent transcriptional regulator [Candidatus Uabimicrobium sp. HlEnr_7]|uniref:sigma-54-dependent transcriptional regulator n=1 Tax=Candidatus Uabimicrobium helgolandensis TaxID=3095367 RepID=UPI003556C42C